MGLEISVNVKGIDLSDVKLDKIKSMEEPSFVSHEPDFGEIDKELERFRNLKNIVVMGNGGSINNTIAIHGALDSTEPWIGEIKIHSSSAQWNQMRSQR